MSDMNYFYLDEIAANRYRCTGCGIRILLMENIVRDSEGMFCKNCGRQIAEKGKLTRDGKAKQNKEQTKSKS